MWYDKNIIESYQWMYVSPNYEHSILSLHFMNNPLQETYKQPFSDEQEKIVTKERKKEISNYF